MRKACAYIAIFLLIFGAISSVQAAPLPVTVDQILYEFDAGVPNLSKFLSVDVTFDVGSSTNELVITLTNTTDFGGSGITFGDLDNFPASVALTSIGFETGGLTIVSSAATGIVFGTDTRGNSVDWTFYWGYDNQPLASGPYLDLATLTVDSVVSTLSAAVEYTFDPSASGGDINGPKHGILPVSYTGTKKPYFAGSATIVLQFNGPVDVASLVTYLNAGGGNVVASFGSPTNVPEPSTILLLGAGLIGLGLWGRRRFKS